MARPSACSHAAILYLLEVHDLKPRACMTTGATLFAEQQKQSSIPAANMNAASTNTTEDRIGLTSLSMKYSSDTNASQKSLILRATGTVLVAILALWGTYAAGSTLFATLMQDNSPCLCGFTTAEGISRKCVFDEIELCWLRPQCIDFELTREFKTASLTDEGGVWQYQTEMDGAHQLINGTQLSMLIEPGRTIWFTYEQHVAHCVFAWRKQFRQQFTGIVMPMTKSDEKHIKHCGKMFMLDSGLEERRTKLVYPSSLPLE